MCFLAKLRCERVFLISGRTVSIYREVASPSWLAGPRGVRSVKEAAEQDKWEGSGRDMEGSGRWLEIWRSGVLRTKMRSARELSVLSVLSMCWSMEVCIVYICNVALSCIDHVSVIWTTPII